MTRPPVETRGGKRNPQTMFDYVMGALGVWFLERDDNGRYTLVTPNGIRLFTVSLKTLEMLGQMFLDEVEREGMDEPHNTEG